MKPVSKFASFFVFPTFVLCAHLFASQVLDLYKTFPNLDIPFHFAGGLSIAYTSTRILSYLEKEKITRALNQVIFLVLIFSLTATATVFWEFAEFIGDQLLNTNIQISLANTLQDQFMGILGGAAWIVLYTRKFEKITDSTRVSR
jgi:predicted PurR-regulated permease PerM